MVDSDFGNSGMTPGASDWLKQYDEQKTDDVGNPETDDVHKSEELQIYGLEPNEIDLLNELVKTSSDVKKEFLKRESITSLDDLDIKTLTELSKLYDDTSTSLTNVAYSALVRVLDTHAKREPIDLDGSVENIGYVTTKTIENAKENYGVSELSIPNKGTSDISTYVMSHNIRYRVRQNPEIDLSRVSGLFGRVESLYNEGKNRALR